jgi:hypothetical protein
VLAKCVAGRDRDWDFAREALRAGVVDPEELQSRVPLLPIETVRQQHIRTNLVAIIEALHA